MRYELGCFSIVLIALAIGGLYGIFQILFPSDPCMYSASQPKPFYYEWRTGDETCPDTFMQPQRQ
jgi:hypothetical protein